MIDKLADIIRGMSKGDFIDKKIIRDESSRHEKIYEYIEFSTDKQVIMDKFELIELSYEKRIRPSNNIYAIDSSTRTIDTPYVFIAVGSATCLNRFTGDAIDYPRFSDVLTKPDIKHDYLVVIPEIEGIEHTFLDILDKMGVRMKNPAGTIYSPRYSKYVVLDELRLSLENIVLNMLLENDKYRDLYVFIDGPIYYTPPLVYQLNELHGIRDELLEQYVEAWKTLVSQRIIVVEKLYREKDIVVAGIVKRLNKSNILSKKNPAGISKGNVSDEVYLSILTETWFKNKRITPFYIGPVIYDPGKLPIQLPRKTLYYVGIPRRRNMYGSSFVNFMFYRTEYLWGLEAPLDPILYDSVYTGSILPLSILLADNKVKKMTTGLLNYLLRSMGLSSESTYQYITF